MWELRPDPGLGRVPVLTQVLSDTAAAAVFVVEPRDVVPCRLRLLQPVVAVPRVDAACQRAGPARRPPPPPLGRGDNDGADNNHDDDDEEQRGGCRCRAFFVRASNPPPAPAPIMSSKLAL